MAVLAAARPRTELAAWSRATLLALLAIAIEWARVLAERLPVFTGWALLLGGSALCMLALTMPLRALGLDRRQLGWRLAAGVVIAAVLLLPAVARNAALPGLPGNLLLPAAIVAVGEEIAFRGALFAALDKAGGPAAAVLGSTAAFVVAHVLSHPPAFLPAVAALGLLLGLWRWACRDLVAPITAHVLADLAL
ncbi:MAG TPA: CPBP family intramembrane glutamic endopeptidase [Candidatus Dormibacteraeota bacterium]